MSTINRSEIEQMISNLSNGTIYSVRFVKKDRVAHVKILLGTDKCVIFVNFDKPSGGNTSQDKKVRFVRCEYERFR